MWCFEKKFHYTYLRNEHIFNFKCDPKCPYNLKDHPCMNEIKIFFFAVHSRVTWESSNVSIIKWPHHEIKWIYRSLLDVARLTWLQLTLVTFVSTLASCTHPIDPLPKMKKKDQEESRKIKKSTPEVNLIQRASHLAKSTLEWHWYHFHSSAWG